ncbi:MAG: DUF488 domain-containing protein [Deltaproteobacteria bacterium]|nr:DUF488 domain-containing protein [Deltaproteobacteria bacterium]
MSQPIFTIGHSTHPLHRFIALLRQHDITALCDVRSNPYSRMNPQFNHEALKQALQQSGITYVFLGKELGARSKDPSCYVRGKVQYDQIQKTDLFWKGIERIREGMKRYRLALMCAEKDPIFCHRTILVARQLDALGLSVEHILEDSSIESHEHALGRLLRHLKLKDNDMFRCREEVIEDAYRIQGGRIAYGKSGVPGHYARPNRSANK